MRDRMSASIRTQAAVVRSLVDELDHFGAEACAVFLREQVKEEVVRLMVLVRKSTTCEVLVSAAASHDPSAPLTPGVPEEALLGPAHPRALGLSAAEHPV